LTLNDGFQVLTNEETAGVSFRSNRGEYRKRQLQPIDFTNGHVDGFQILDVAQTDDEFRLVAPVEFDSLPRESNRVRFETTFKTSINKPVCFIDGEGANHGSPVVVVRSNNLLRKKQEQNYALLSATLEPAECNMDCFGCSSYMAIIGNNNHDQLSSRLCLEFILHIPATHIIVGYGLSYDVEHWLKDIPESKMIKLRDTGKVWWRDYLIQYIPNKVFSISKWKRKLKNGSVKTASRTVYDIVGFFQSPFANAIGSWNVGTQLERDYIAHMKSLRPDFGDVTNETLTYNHMEGKHGIQLFKRVRAEYTKLQLKVPRPVGAGSIASAMFRRHRIDSHFPVFQSLPVDVMLQSYIGGRFDIARIGFVGDIYEYDINSAYPHIARNLPCLAHTKFEWTNEYVRDSHSLWLVRWRDNENPWSPFPYRTPNGEHIRYFASGTGYYYGSEVESALRLDSDIEVIGGFRCICECDERPFKWIEDYYLARQEMKRNHDFAEIIIKLGLNSVYGKLAQSKGKSPRWQNFIWAGMITSGTRAMLMDAVARNPTAVFKLSTDAVFSTEPLDLPLGNELGQWKPTQLEDLLVLGNGIYHSPTLDENGIPIASKNRGYLKGPEYFDWELIRKNFANGIPSVVTKHEFMKFTGAYHSKKMEERCTWIDEQQFLDYEPPSGKELRGGWIWPGQNETPLIESAPIRVKEENLRKWGE
jgi:hypothetical protein